MAQSDYKMLINGNLVDAEKTFGVINPSTGQVFAQCPDCSQDQLNEAVASAKAAFETWQHSTYEERKACMDKAIAKGNEKMAEICEILVKEQGKPMGGAQWEIGAIGAFFGAFSQIKVEDKVLSQTAEEKVIQKRAPLGVVAGICPWNFPVLMGAWKLGEAAMTGNTLVWKPSPFTPLATLFYGQVIADCFPPGVVNIVSGGDDLGRWIVDHPDIAKISFTGSIATGKKIQAAAAATLKRVTLELGGNDPAIILEDADVKAVAPQVFQHAMFNSGQTCISIKRCYVPDAMYDEFVEELTKCAGAAKVEDGMNEGAAFGPIQNKMQFDKVAEIVEDAKRNGGKVEIGGEAQAGDGYFYPLTVMSNMKDGMRLVDEEQFGPVLPVIRYSTTDEVIKAANATKFGLGGSVWGSEAKANAIAHQIDAGTVWVNQHLAISPDVAFGGMKESGMGRQMGPATIEGYTESKIIRIKNPEKASKKEQPAEPSNKYVERHNFKDLLQSLTLQMLADRPEQPITYLQDLLTAMENGGAKTTEGTNFDEFIKTKCASRPRRDE